MATLTAVAQNPILVPQGAPNRAFVFKGGVVSDSLLQVPVQSNDALYPDLQQKGRIRLNALTGVLQYNNGTSWINVGTGTGMTNLSYTASPTNGQVNSDTGTPAILPTANGTNAGLLPPAGFNQLLITSGTNTGDNAANTNSNAYADAAANARQATLVSGTNIKTLENQTLLGSGNIDLGKADVGLANADNTSDVNKPVSTAQAAAIALKANLSGGNAWSGSQTGFNVTTSAPGTGGAQASSQAYTDAAATAAASIKISQNNPEIKATTTGTNTYAATLSPAITSYVDGAAFVIKFSNANTGASTINFNGLGAKNITVGGFALPSGLIDANIPYLLIYNSTTDAFRITTSNKVPTQAYGDASLNIANMAAVQAAVLALNSNFVFNNIDATPSSTLTGTTSQTILRAKAIPINSFQNGVLSIRYSVGGTGTAGTKQFLIWIGPNNTNLTGAVQVARLNMTTPQISAPIWRDYSISDIANISDTTGTIKGYPFDANSAVPAGSTLALGSGVINPTVQLYIITTGQLDNSGDSQFVDYSDITIKKSN